MAIDFTIRMLSFGMLVALSASSSNAQDSQTLASSEAVPASPAGAELSLPNAPKVTCAGGNLTISADNSTLGAILNAVHVCTGVQIDVPEGASARRTFEELGPGPERQVLDSLLSGTGYNFVIESTDANPQKIESVMLMPRTLDASTVSATGVAASSPARRAWIQSVKTARRATETADESQTETDETQEAPAKDESAAEPAEAAAASTPAAPVSDLQPVADSSPAPPDNSSAPAPAVDSASNFKSADKTTADRISSMQSMFEQRKQMNQNQNPAAPQ